MARLRVLIVNALFHPFKGGVEKHLLELGKAMVTQGVEVHVLTAQLSGTQKYEKMFGMHVHRLPCTEIRLPTLYPPPAIIAPDVYAAIEKLDKKYSFDLIHLQDRWFPDFAMALAYAKSHGKPFVVTLHNARPLGIAPHYTIFGSIYDSIIGKPVLKNADLIISVSRWAIGDIAHYGISRSKMVAIHNGIATADYAPSPRRAAEFRRNFGYFKNDKLLLFVGRIIRQKGIENILRAMPSIIAREPNAHLIIVGRGGRLAQMEKLASSLGTDQRVSFVGFLGEQELKDALSACDLFVLPSLWEVLPMSILEAMAAGKPVVCSDVGGNSELVRNGFNGFLVPKNNVAALSAACVRVLSDPKLGARLGRNGRIRAKREFDWKLIAAKTISTYRKLIGSHRAAGRTKVPIEIELVSLSEKMKANARKQYASTVEKSFKSYVKEFGHLLQAVKNGKRQ